MEVKYGSNKMRIHETFINQTGTAGAVDISQKAATTVTQIGKTEVNLKVIASAADAPMLHAIITAYYKDADGVSHVATIADATADMSAATDFDTPVTDFYCWDHATAIAAGTTAFTSSIATGVGKTLSATDETLVYAVIAATKAAGTILAYFGVGTVYGRLAIDHADGDNYVATMKWISPWGTIHDVVATCTLTATSTDEIIFIQTDGYPVQDFYHIRSLRANKVTTANTGAFLLTDVACANVDGSGADVWGGIAQGSHEAIFTKYFVPAGAIAFMARMEGAESSVIGVDIALTYTHVDGIVETGSYPVPQDSQYDFQPLIQLEPLTFISMTMVGNTGKLYLHNIILEASDQNA